MNRKNILIVLTVLFVLLLCSCGNASQENHEISDSSKDLVESDIVLNITDNNGEDTIATLHYLRGEEYSAHELFEATYRKFFYVNSLFNGNYDMDYNAESSVYPGYYKVVNQEFTDIEGLKQFVESKMTKELAEELFYSKKLASENFLFVDDNGVLYGAMVDGPSMPYDVDTIKVIEENEETAKLSLLGEQYQVVREYILTIEFTEDYWIVTDFREIAKQ